MTIQIDQATKEAVIAFTKACVDNYTRFGNPKQLYTASMMHLKAVSGEFDAELKDYVACNRKRGN